jgi:hypothetical protein
MRHASKQGTLLPNVPRYQRSIIERNLAENAPGGMEQWKNGNVIIKN